MGNSATKGLLIGLSVTGTSLYPLLACGLGLSEIQLESRLNQPLRARIEVLDVTDEEWRQLRTQLNLKSPESMPIHPELLDAVTLRLMEDASHRHFVEVHSNAAIVEPLFDLPIEVFAPTAHLLRSYSVMLDPALSDDVPVAGTQTTPDTQRVVEPTQAPAIQQTVNTAPATDSPSAARTAPAKARGAATNTRHKHRRHRRSGSHATTGSSAAKADHPAQKSKPAQRASTALTQDTTQTQAPVQPQEPANRESEQQELRQQLATLQQTLTQMQATIAAQNAQIADLNAKIAARAQFQAAHAAPAPVARTAEESQAGSPEAADSQDTPAKRNWRPYVWGAGFGLAALFAGIAAVFMRKRAARHDDADTISTPLTPAFRAAVESSAIAARAVPQFSAPVAPAPVFFKDTTPPAAAPVETSLPETEKLPAMTLDDMTNAYFADLPKTAVKGKPAAPADEASTQLAELDAAALLAAIGQSADTESLPGLDETVPVIEETQPLPSAGGHSAVTLEITQVLEKSLLNEPHRVDIKIKLLEIYHHEGNLLEFSAVLDKLLADSRLLTPEQRAYVEKLERSLAGEEELPGTANITRLAI